MAVLLTAPFAILSASHAAPADAARTGPEVLTTVAGDASVRRGAVATFRVAVRNVGTAATTAPVTLTLGSHLSPDLANVTVDAPDWSCADDAQGVPRCRYDDAVPAGGRFPPLVVRGTATEPPGYTGTEFEVHTGTPDVSPSSWATAQVPVTDASTADLVLSVTSPTPSPRTGDRSYAVRVRNTGPAITTEPIVVTPSQGYGPSRSSGPGWSCDAFTGACTSLLPLLSGAVSAPITTVLTTASNPYTAGGVLSTRVSGGGDVDPHRGNDGASAAATLVPPSQVDLTVAVTGDEDPPAAATAGFVVQVANAGLRPSVGPVTVELARDRYDGLGPGGASGAGWTCSTVRATCTADDPIPARGLAPPLRVRGVRAGQYDLATLLATVSGGDDGHRGNDTGTASRPAPAVAPAAPAVVLRNVLPRRRGTSGTVSVDVANLGARPLDGPVTARLSAPFASTASGDGWTCTAALVCRRDAGPAPGEHLPPIDLVIPVPDDADRTSYPVGATVRTGASAETYVTASFNVGAPLTDVVLSIPELDPVVPGERATVPFVVRNVGVIDAAGPAVVVVEVPFPGSTFSGDGWSCVSPDTRGRARCVHDGPVPASRSLPRLTMTVPVPDAGAPGALQVVGELAMPAGSDVDPDNDRASATATIGAGTVDLTGTFTDVTPEVGDDDGTASFVVHNAGSAASSGPIRVRNQSWRGIDGNGWRCVYRCSHPGPVPADGDLPPLRLITGPDSDMQADVSGGGDSQPRNNHALIRVPRAPSKRGRWLEVQAFAPYLARPGSTVDIGGTIDVGRGSEAVPGPVSLVIDPSPGVVVEAVTGGDGVRCTGLRCIADDVDAYRTRRFGIRARIPREVAGPSTVRLRVSAPGTPDATPDEFLVRVQPVGTAGDLVGTLDDAAPTGPGGTSTALLAVRNLGGSAVRGPVIASVGTAYGAPGTVTDLSGDGWQCEPESFVCEHDGPVPAGGALPPIRAQVRADRDVGRGRVVELTSYVRTDSDDDTGVDNASGIGSMAVSAAGTANLTAAVSADGPVTTSGESTFRARVRNVGSVASTGPVEVRLQRGDFGPGTFSASGPSWSCPPGGDRCVRREPLAAGEQAPDLTLRATDTFDPALSATSKATIALTAAEGSIGDDTARAETPRLPRAAPVGVDVLTALTGGAPVVDGGTTDLVATVHGVGTVAGSGGTVVQVTAPDARATAAGDGWTCDAELRCSTPADAAPGGTLPPITVRVRPATGDQAGAVTVTAAASVAGDVRPDNDRGVAGVGIGDGGVDLSVRTVTDVPARAGGESSHLVRVTNTGSTVATGQTAVTVTSTFAPILSGAGWSCDGTRCTTTTPVAAGGTLPDLRVVQRVPADVAYPDTFSVVDARVTNADDAASGNDRARNGAGVGAGDRAAAPRSARLAVDATRLQASPGDRVPIQVAFRGALGEASRTGTLTVDLPAGLRYEADPADGPAPTVSGRRLTWDVALLDGRLPTAMRFTAAVESDAPTGTVLLSAALRVPASSTPETDASPLVVVPRPDAPTDPGTGTGTDPGTGTGTDPGTGTGGAAESSPDPGLAALLAAIAAQRPVSPARPATSPRAPATPPGPVLSLRFSGAVRPPRLPSLVRSGWSVAARTTAATAIRAELVADRATARRLRIRVGSVVAGATVGRRSAGVVRLRLRVPTALRPRVRRSAVVSGTLRLRSSSADGSASVTRRVSLRR